MSRMFGHGPLEFGRMSSVIKGLVVANVAAFILAQLAGHQFLGLFGLVPSKVVGDFWLWQPFTYLFLHAGVLHLLFNLFALWMFGMPVEAQWGGREFLRYFLICGVGAGLFNVALTPGSDAPIIGASGAIFGLLVAFAMLYPDAVVYLYFFFPIKAKHMALLFGVLEFTAGFSARTPAVARFAHLGGMVIGYVYIRWGWLIRTRARAVLQESIKPALGPRRPRRKAENPRLTGPADEMAEVDRILDKILAQGEESLTEPEREVLRRHARRNKQDA